ncbi:hypothetical protein L484_014532 [Morus notabilis]|uniref:Uncharacterized protein n=1 Tax=Morus notabilis TaxID=981085 RepID=W9RYW3_9ROSA|nr:hypothetical protein L484_014532 [Morus notabilis]
MNFGLLSSEQHPHPLLMPTFSSFCFARGVIGNTATDRKDTRTSRENERLSSSFGRGIEGRGHDGDGHGNSAMAVQELEKEAAILVIVSDRLMDLALEAGLALVRIQMAA